MRRNPMLKKLCFVTFLLAALMACGRPEKPVAKVAGKWISFDQWQAFVKAHSLSSENDPEKLKTGLTQLVRREIAFERAKRRGLLSGAEWDQQIERMERTVLVKNYVTDKILQGKADPAPEEIASVMREERSKRHIMGVGVKDPAEAASVADELRRGADIRAVFEKHRGEMKSGPTGYDLGMASRNQLPPEIQARFFDASPGTVLDPVKFGNEGYIVPVLQELSEPDPSAKPDQNTVKRAGMLKFQRAVKKANDDLKAKYPEAFDTALVSNLLKNEKPNEEELNKKVGSVGKDNIPYSLLLDAYYGESQRSGSPLPRTVEVFQGLFSMIASERRIAAAAIAEGYLKKEEVKSQIWDFTREFGAVRFMQDYVKNYVVKEDKLKEYFESHKDSFAASSRYHLRYLISADPNAIQNALMMMKKGAQWEEAIKAPGILPETGNGDLGWKSQEELNGMLEPRLLANIAKAPLGSWAADQIGPGKFGAFQVFEKEAGAPADFEKAREEVNQRYIKDNGAALIQDYLDKEGREGIKVETFPPEPRLRID